MSKDDSPKYEICTKWHSNMHEWMEKNFGVEHWDDVSYQHGNWTFKFNVQTDEYTWYIRHYKDAVLVWLVWT